MTSERTMAGAGAGAGCVWEDLVLWRAPLRSGIVLGAGVALYVVVCVLQYSVTALVAGAAGVALAIAGVHRFAQRHRPRSVPSGAAYDWECTMDGAADAAAARVTAALVWTHGLVTWRDWRHSAVVLAACFAVSNVASVLPLSACALCVWVGAFCVPFVWGEEPAPCGAAQAAPSLAPTAAGPTAELASQTEGCEEVVRTPAGGDDDDDDDDGIPPPPSYPPSDAGAEEGTPAAPFAHVAPVRYICTPPRGGAEPPPLEAAPGGVGPCVPAGVLDAEDVIEAIFAEHGLSPPRPRDASEARCDEAPSVPAAQDESKGTLVTPAQSAAPPGPLSAAAIIGSICRAERLTGTPPESGAAEPAVASASEPAGHTSLQEGASAMKTATSIDLRAALPSMPSLQTPASVPPVQSTANAAPPARSTPRRISAACCPVTGVHYRQGRLRGLRDAVTVEQRVLYAEVAAGWVVCGRGWVSCIVEVTLHALRLYIPPEDTLAALPVSELREVTRDVLEDGDHVELTLVSDAPGGGAKLQLPIAAGDALMGLLDLILRNTQEGAPTTIDGSHADVRAA